MPFCPTCRTEYRAEFARCADCGLLLEETLPPARAPQPTGPIGAPVEEVVVATFATALEASMWAERLKAEGIPVIFVGSGGEWTEGAVWPPALRVRASDYDRARRLLPPH